MFETTGRDCSMREMLTCRPHVVAALEPPDCVAVNLDTCGRSRTSVSFNTVRLSFSRSRTLSFHQNLFLEITALPPPRAKLSASADTTSQLIARINSLLQSILNSSLFFVQFHSRVSLAREQRLVQHGMSCSFMCTHVSPPFPSDHISSPSPFPPQS
jgi:hypothetical protein